MNKHNNRYVFIDTETGGTNPEKHSLFSIGLIVWDVHKGIIAEKEFFVASKEYRQTKESKRVNKINVEEHNKIAIPPNQVISEMLEYLGEYIEDEETFHIIGHNVQFDIGFIKYLFKECNKSYDKYFSHRSIDTYSVYKTLEISGKIDDSIESSDDAFAYFGIVVDGRHSAIGDCRATVKLYEKLIDYCKNK